MDVMFATRHGGIVPTDMASEDDAVMIAFSGSNPELLGDRKIVRIVPEKLELAEKLTQEVLGLDSFHSEPIGVGLVRAIGFPAWPILQDPENAHHALNIVGDLEWAKKMAKGAPNKVAERFQELVKQLTNSAPHFLPTLLEELARIYDNVGNAKFAQRYFSSAREVERSYGLPVDAERHRQVFLEFSSRGLVAAKELSALGAQCKMWFDNEQETFEFFYNLNVSRVQAGGAPYTTLVRDLTKLGKSAGYSQAEVTEMFARSVVGTSGMRKATKAFVMNLGKALGKNKDIDPSLILDLYKVRPIGINIREWVEVLRVAGIFDVLGKTPDRIVPWVHGLLEEMESCAERSSDLCAFILENRSYFSGQTMTLPFAKISLEFLAVLQEVGVTLEFDDGKYEVYPQLDFLVDFIKNKPVVDLNRAFEDDRLRRRIVGDKTLEQLLTGYEGKLQKLRLGGLILDKLREELQNLNLQPYLASLEPFARTISKIRNFDIPLDISKNILELTNITEEEILICNLRAGLITEFTWPELEKHTKEWLGTISPNNTYGGQLRFYPSYPGVVAFFKQSVAAVEGNQTIGTHKFGLEKSLSFSAYTQSSGNIIVASANRHGEVKAEWSQGEPVVTEVDSERYYYYLAEDSVKLCDSLPIEGGRILPGGVLLDGESKLSIHEHDRLKRMFSDASGKVWVIDKTVFPSSNLRVQEINPETGTVVGTQAPAVFEQVLNGNFKIDPNISTYVAVCPSYNPQTSIVPSSNQNLVFIAAESVDNNVPNAQYCIILGDGREFFSQDPLVGVIEAAGVIWLVGTNGRLYIPTENGSSIALATTLDHRGESHWLHQLPWITWANLSLRSETASQRLRKITVQQAEQIIGAIDRKQLKVSRHETKSEAYVRPYDTINLNCKSESEAMKVVGEILDCKDEELCASVVYRAIESIKLAKIMAFNRKYFTRKIKELTAAESETNADANANSAESHNYVEKKNRGDFIATTNHASLAGREFGQLTNAIEGKQSRRSKKWLWLQVICREKPFIVWAKGILSTPHIRHELATLLSDSLASGFMAPKWRQIYLDWGKLAAKFGKSQMGLVFVPDKESKAVVIGRLDKYLRVLIQGEVPDSLQSSVNNFVRCEGLPYDIDMKISDNDARRWIQELLCENEIDIELWKAEMQPFVRALTENSALTESAAWVLLAGGYNPSFARVTTGALDLPYFDYRGRYNIDYLDKEHIKSARKKLKLSTKAHKFALQQLSGIKDDYIEMLLAAVFDRDLAAFTAVAHCLPQVEVDLQESDMLTLTDWGYEYDESVVVPSIWRALRPLPRKIELKGGTGYSRIAGVVLYFATRAQGNDPLRGFYAKQLETIKNIDWIGFSSEHVSDLPLQGELLNDETTWLYAHGDAVRAVQEGCFDRVIESLRRPEIPSGCLFDPRVSAATTVKKVQEELGLSEHAAVYFLQVLCLVECSDVNIKRWNNWRKRDLDEARAELAQKDLIILATRSRTGRSAFLPGSWWRASNPNPGMEEWKARYYLVRFSEYAFSVVPWCPPILPYDELFQAAWERYASGDTPKFQELTTKKYRKRN
ncbi:hypothetical protein [Corynebacterium freiburgense]|uniref:hypothetical protein n=1 Tax=Corynebacterium freiburgense TaxID=556548 RepID=UPI0004094CA2|nr:hypothetical protein [Corynebacterium freiburgense]WJZ02566.1 hypothetical protein CFREI_06395 [Corynebacterium freiburgense]